jgi:DNA-binding beta-propeller fold protein YncE
MNRLKIFSFLVLAGVWVAAWGYRQWTTPSTTAYIRRLALTQAVGQPLRWPRGIASDVAGNVILADTDNDRLVKLSPNGSVLWSVGRYGQRPGDLDHPMDVTIGKDGLIYVANTMNNRIDAFDSQGRFVRTVSDRLPQPCSVVSTPSGDLWVSAGSYTVGRYRTLRMDMQGKIMSRGGPVLIGEVIDGAGEVLYVAGRRRTESISALQVFSPPYASGSSRWKLDGIGEPNGLAVSPDGRMAVTDFDRGYLEVFKGNRRIAVLPPALFKIRPKEKERPYPSGVAFDPQGRLWVTTREGVLRFDPQ